MKMSFNTPGTLPELPSLTGTPKQVAWAEKIRASLIRANKGNEGNNVLRAALAQADARFWIDTRDMDFVAIGAVVSNIEQGHDLRTALFNARYHVSGLH